MKFPFWPDISGYRNIDLGLSRVYQLLERLDNPHLKLPPTIHLAGTNGKGSTLSFLRTIFSENNLKVHTYTSPHLVNFNERITLCGTEISDDFLNQILHECKAAAELSPKIPVTFFEGITVAAFLAFSRVKADVLLLETGMGGRLDATNVLPQVLCSVITPIAFDHTEFLGNSLKKIAFEKAGIIKKNCPVIIGKQKPSALKILASQGSALESLTKIFNRDWKITKVRNGFRFSGFDQNLKLPLPALPGDHQIENASLAIAAALTQQHFKISTDSLKSAVQKTFWPCRLQKINSGKFYNILPKNSELYVDGSHNIQGATTIYKFLRQQKNKKKFVIFAMLKDKDCSGFLQKIASEINHLVAVEIDDEPKSRRREEILNIAQKLQISAVGAENMKEALGKIKCDEPCVVLVCGSLYLAGNFLAENLSDDVVNKLRNTK